MDSLCIKCNCDIPFINNYVYFTSDDQAIIQTSIANEYQYAYKVFNMDPSTLTSIVFNSARAAFLPKAEVKYM